MGSQHLSFPRKRLRFQGNDGREGIRTFMAVEYS